MKNKTYHTIRTVLKYSRKTVERGKINITNTQIHDRSIKWRSSTIFLCAQTLI